MKCVFIDQGCYGVLRPNGQQEVNSLITDGLYNCCSIAAWREGHMFLCHADALTNLTNPKFGFIAWARKLPRSRIPIEIRYNDDSHPEIRKNLFRAIAALQRDYRLLVHAAPAPDGMRTVVLYRDGGAHPEHAVYSSYLPRDIRSKNVPLNEYAGSINGTKNTHSLPPVCIYDDSGIELTPEVVANFYERQRSPNFALLIRVLRRPPLTPTSDEERQDDHGVRVH
ncbi:MAG: hypothetical protein A2X77_05200 [Gammaproteobacteria bacterium GWE2_42_36]|nr:MAG: hypothetical protein A2X77_05200 [Gammaproteobacteria bacterium GWE2_42_36]HCU05869.1 hypothetical protein [Coxiellaceae bacterium]